MSDASAKRGAVHAILRKAIISLGSISCVVIFIMMVLTFIDVIGRYAFHKPIFGGTEVISALLALKIFSGLSVINARDDHITVELIDLRFRRMSTPLAYEIIIQSFSVVAMTLIAAVLLEHAWEAYMLEKFTEVLELSVFYVSGIVAVFAVVSVLSQIIGVALRIVDIAAERPRSKP